MKANLINEGVKYGIICGLTAVLLMYGSWAVSIGTFTSVMFTTTFIPYMIAILLFGGFAVRKLNGGYLNFQEGLKLFKQIAISNITQLIKQDLK